MILQDLVHRIVRQAVGCDQVPGFTSDEFCQAVGGPDPDAAAAILMYRKGLRVLQAIFDRVNPQRRLLSHGEVGYGKAGKQEYKPG